MSAINIKPADVKVKSNTVDIEETGADSITIANSLKDDVTEIVNSMNYFDVEEISCIITSNCDKKPVNQDSIHAERRSL